MHAYNILQMSCIFISVSVGLLFNYASDLLFNCIVCGLTCSCINIVFIAKELLSNFLCNIQYSGF